MWRLSLNGKKSEIYKKKFGLPPKIDGFLLQYFLIERADKID